jgi:hypothetical protein
MEDNGMMERETVSVGDSCAVRRGSVLPSIPFRCLPFHSLWLVISSIPFLVAQLVIIGSCFLVYNDL